MTFQTSRRFSRILKRNARSRGMLRAVCASPQCSSITIRWRSWLAMSGMLLGVAALILIQWPSSRRNSVQSCENSSPQLKADLSRALTRSTIWKTKIRRVPRASAAITQDYAASETPLTQPISIRRNTCRRLGSYPSQLRSMARRGR